MLTDKDIFNNALHDCMKELYKRSQPSEDWDKILKDAEEGKIKKDERIYERYYLSFHEYKYVVDKYVNAYMFNKKWDDYVQTVYNYLEKGGTKDKYIKDYTDERGNHHPGYRGYEKVPPVATQVKRYLEDNISNEYIGKIEELSNDISDIVLKTVKTCQDFYMFDRTEDDFRCAIALSLPSPTSNKETVIEYWKTQGKDIKIEDRNPLLFWYEDYYGDELDDIMTEEYGKDWRKKYDEEWEEEQRKQKEELDKKTKELEELFKNMKEQKEIEENN